MHVLEHVRDLFTLLAELYPVLSPGGGLHVMVPEWRHPNAVVDPTHVRFFGHLNFRDFCRPGRGRRLEPVALSVIEDTVFAGLEPVHGEATAPVDAILGHLLL